MSSSLRLGVNIDHVATVRNARGGSHPAPLRAAQTVIKAGADSLTIHLREDRRHIRDADVSELIQAVDIPINLEIAATAEMQRIALETLPAAVCIVPEKRAELTTEGGLNAVSSEAALVEFVRPLTAAGIRVSLFIDPEQEQIAAAHRIGVGAIELHTGAYAHAVDAKADVARELDRLRRAAAATRGTGMECHAGHGLTYANVEAIAVIPEIIELNIGHFLIGEAVFVGLETAVARMRQLMTASRVMVAGQGDSA
jgi:pyridoxine 5-phosphate synthase